MENSVEKYFDEMLDSVTDINDNFENKDDNQELEKFQKTLEELDMSKQDEELRQNLGVNNLNNITFDEELDNNNEKSNSIIEEPNIVVDSHLSNEDLLTLIDNTKSSEEFFHKLEEKDD